MNRTFYSLLLAAALTGAATAGPITLTLQNNDLSTEPGGSVTFQATAVNNMSFTENLNGDSLGALDPPLTLDDSAFLNNWPFYLTADQTFGPEALFAIDVPLGTAPGDYLGSFSILGGSGVNDQNLLATVDFTVTVTSASSAPEPGTFVTLGGALVGLGLWVRRWVARRGRSVS
jgi:hypothetical protein